MTPADLTQLKSSIQDWSRELGFDAMDVTDVHDQEAEQRLLAWLQQGYHAEMTYMTKHGRKRSQPDLLIPGTTRVMSFRMNYLPAATNPWAILRQKNKAYITRYALGADYHRLIRKRLQVIIDRCTAACGNTYSFRAFTDSAPVLEKALAERAGLGWIGKNTLLLNRSAGSLFFLAEVYTDLPLPIATLPGKSLCGSCSACLDICPTNAFVAPYVLDSSRCISYLTIEYKGSIPIELRPLIGNRVFGCDDCQLVCPWNRYARRTEVADFSPRHGLDDANLVQLFNWTEEEFLNKTSGSALRRTGYQCWLRNLAIALGNAPADPQILQALTARQANSSDLVREHIEWAIKQQLTRKL